MNHKTNDFKESTRFTIAILVLLFSWGAYLASSQDNKNLEGTIADSLEPNTHQHSQDDSEYEAFSAKNIRASLIQNSLIKKSISKHPDLKFALSTLLGSPGRLSLAAFEKRLRAISNKVVKKRDGNSETGEMISLFADFGHPRKSSLSAQFFQEGGKYRAHNLSFILKVDSSQARPVISEIYKELQGLGSNLADEPGGGVWPLSNGYVFWMRELRQTDIYDDEHMIAKNVQPGEIQLGLDMNIH